MAAYDMQDSDVMSVLDFDIPGCDTLFSEVVTSIAGEPSG
jgi:hypothetical protein